MFTTVKGTTCGIIGFKETVVRAALSPTGTLLNLVGNPKFLKQWSDEPRLQLCFIPSGGCFLLTLPEIHDVRSRFAKLIVAKFIPCVCFREILVEVVV
jgi:hypothetical protein